MMQTTSDFSEKVRRRFLGFLDTARTKIGAEADAREEAIRQTAKTLRADGFFGLTDADVRRNVRDHG